MTCNLSGIQIVCQVNPFELQTLIKKYEHSKCFLKDFAWVALLCKHNSCVNSAKVYVLFSSVCFGRSPNLLNVCNYVRGIKKDMSNKERYEE